MFKKIFIVILIVIIVAVTWIVTHTHKQTPEANNNPVVCTLDAKLCPDGSYVSRIGPDCHLAECPSSTADWLTSTTTPTFEYPKQLVTNYIHFFDWPPKIQITNEPYSCTAGGSSTAVPAGQTVERTINGHPYCVTTESEGAAGSVYIMYAYVFPAGDKTATLTFSIREVQCDNYDEPQKTECGNERQSFNLDIIIDRIAQTLEVQ